MNHGRRRGGKPPGTAPEFTQLHPPLTRGKNGRPSLTRMLNRFVRQFSGPSGPLGRVAGGLMARMNGPLNDWAVELLELSPRDRVLEVGYGPGLAIERIAARTRQGLVVGVDHSELMRRQAARRNRAGLDAGRVELHVGERRPAAAARTRASRMRWP